MPRNALVWVRLAMLPAILAVGLPLVGCSSKGDGDPTGGGGGGGREFVSGNLAGNGASFSHTFATAGSYPYYCRYHGGRGGSGMSGVITVTNPPNASPQTFSYSIVGHDLPNYAIKTGDIVQWTNNSNETHTVESDN